MNLCAFFGIFQLVTVLFLHVSFVGQGKCIEAVLNDRVWDQSDMSKWVNMSLNPGLNLSDGILLVNGNETNLLPADTNYTYYPPNYKLRDDEFLQIEVVSTRKGGGSEGRRSGIYNASEPLPGGESDADGESFSFTPNYIFSTNQAVLYLNNNFRDVHGVRTLNLTLTDRCMLTGVVEKGDSEGSKEGSKEGSSEGSSSLSSLGTLSTWDKASRIFSGIYGYDAAIINQLMYGVKARNSWRGYSPGFLQNLETKELWNWRPSLLVGLLNLTPFEWFVHKFVVVLNCAISFLLISSVTAFVVRILLSSGVVIMFVIFGCMRMLGADHADDRLLSLSYPWIGRGLVSIDTTGTHPRQHYLFGHIGKVIIFYGMYEASQTVFGGWLYDKSIPNGMVVLIFGLVMIWEVSSCFEAKPWAQE